MYVNTFTKESVQQAYHFLVHGDTNETRKQADEYLNEFSVGPNLLIRCRRAPGVYLAR